MILQRMLIYVFFMFIHLFFFSDHIILSILREHSGVLLGRFWAQYGCKNQTKVGSSKEMFYSFEVGSHFSFVSHYNFPQENQGNEFIICTVVSLQCEEWSSLGHHNEPRFAD